MPSHSNPFEMPLSCRRLVPGGHPGRLCGLTGIVEVASSAGATERRQFEDGQTDLSRIIRDAVQLAVMRNVLHMYARRNQRSVVEDTKVETCGQQREMRPE
jgi:hypothetical protein